MLDFHDSTVSAGEMKRADEMNDVGIHYGRWEDVAEHLGQRIESITHDVEDVLDARLRCSVSALILNIAPSPQVPDCTRGCGDPGQSSARWRSDESSLCLSLFYVWSRSFTASFSFLVLDQPGTSELTTRHAIPWGKGVEPHVHDRPPMGSRQPESYCGNLASIRLGISLAWSMVLPSPQAALRISPVPTPAGQCFYSRGARLSNR